MGENTVNGRLSGFCEPIRDSEGIAVGGDCNDAGFGDQPADSTADGQDSFIFTVGTGFEFRDIRVSAEGTAPDGFVASFDLAQLTGDSAGFLKGVNFGLNVGGSSFESLVLGEGTYSFSSIAMFSDEPGDFDYGWSASGTGVALGPVAPVPLPASLPILLAGLGALGLLQRKRR